MSSIEKSADTVLENNGASSTVVPETDADNRKQPSTDIGMAELQANEISNIAEDVDQVTNGTTGTPIEEAIASDSIAITGDDNLDDSVSTNNSEADEAVAADDE